MQHRAWRCLCVLLLMLSCKVGAQTVSLNWNNKPPAGVEDNIALALESYAGFAQCDDISSLALDQQRQALGRLILDSFRSFGFYATQITALDLVSPTQCQQWQVNFVLGEPARLKQINIDADAPLSDNPVLAGIVSDFNTLIGERFSQAQYNQLKDRLYSQAIAQGFFDIEVGSSAIRVADNFVDVTLEYAFVFGERYHIRRMVLLDNTLDETLLNNIITLTPNTPYSLERVTEMRSALNLSGYFNNVQIRPDIAKRSDGKVDLLARLQEKNKHYLEYGIGFSTDVGPRASASLRRPRLNEAGHSLRLNTQISVPEQQLTATYKVPLSDPNEDYINYQLGIERINFNETESNSVSLGATRFFPMRSLSENLTQWKGTIFTRFDYADFTQNTQNTNTTLLFWGASMHYLNANDVLFPSRGERHDITLETAQNWVLSDFSVYRLTAQTKWLRPLTEKWSWLGIGRAGLLSTDAFLQTPTDLRFFVGGDQSVRGFGYKDLAPINLQGELLGGDKFVSTQQELIYHLDDQWGVATFIDAAKIQKEASRLHAKSAGIGAIWRSPIGPVRVYIARGTSDLEAQWRLHLLLGPQL